MNMKKIICCSLALGCVLSLTSCSNVKQNSSNSAVEDNKTTIKEDESKKIDNEIAKSIIEQLKSQINAKDRENQKIVIENNTEYVYRQAYMNFTIKDNDGINAQAQLMLNVDHLEPGQKCYADFYMISVCNDAKEIKYSGNFYDERLGDSEYDATKIDISEMTFVSGNNEDEEDCIRGIIKNTYGKDYSNVGLQLMYIDEEGFINNIGGDFIISEFISGESYYVEFYNYFIDYDITEKDKDNLILKMYLK